MDKYFLAIIGLIIFSVVIILYIRISARINNKTEGKSNDLNIDNFLIIE